MDSRDFNYLFKKKRDKEAPTSNTGYAKIATFVLFFIFLFGFLEYAPYATSSTKPHNASIFSELFWLYFFVVQQTLGIVHEGGHGVCYIFHCPEFFTVINGTIFQWLFPAGIGLYFYKRGNRLAGYIGLFFLGVSMQYTAWYISTAHEGLIVPASKSFLGVDGYHDFNYILSIFHAVKYDWLIANIVKLFAYVAMVGSVLLMFLQIFKKKGS